MDATFLYSALAIMLLVVIGLLGACAFGIYRQSYTKSRQYIMTVTDDGRVKVRRYRAPKNVTVDRIEKW